MSDDTNDDLRIPALPAPVHPPGSRGGYQPTMNPEPPPAPKVIVPAEPRPGLPPARPPLRTPIYPRR